MKQITNTYQKHFSRSYESRSSITIPHTFNASLQDRNQQKNYDWDNDHDLHIWGVTHPLFDNKMSFYRPKAHSDLVYIFDMKTFFL